MWPVASGRRARSWASGEAASIPSSASRTSAWLSGWLIGCTLACGMASALVGWPPAEPRRDLGRDQLERAERLLLRRVDRVDLDHQVGRAGEQPVCAQAGRDPGRV